MPILDDLLAYPRTLQQMASESAIWRMLSSPLQTAAGIGEKAILDVPQALATQASNLSQAVAGKDYVVAPLANMLKSLMPWTDPNQPVAPTEPPPETIAQQVGQASNAALLGLPNALHRRIQAEEEKRGSEGIEANLVNLLVALPKFAAADVAQIPSFLKILGKGVNEETGEPLTARELGGEAVNAAMGMVPILKAMKPGAVRWLLGEVEQSSLKKALTAGEIMAPPEVRKAAGGQAKLPRLKKGEAGSDPLDPGKRDPTILAPEQTVEDVFKGGILNPEEAHALVGELVASPSLTPQLVVNVLKKAKETGDYRRSALIADMIREGALSEESAARYAAVAVNSGTPLPKVLDLAADNYLRAESVAGDLLAASSNFDKMYGRLLMQADAGDVMASQAIKLLEQSGKLAGQGPNKLSWLNQWFRTGERWRRGLMVSQLATTMRNISVQGIVGINNLFESAIEGTLETAIGAGRKVMGRPENFSLSRYYSDLLGNVEAMVNHVGYHATRGKGPFYNLDEAINLTPLLKKELLGESAFEVGTVTSKDILNFFKGKSESIEKAGDAFVGTLNFFNRMQEMEFRRLFFQQRLLANAKGLGLKGGNEIVEALRQPTPLPGLKEGLADAFEHAMKSTFSFTPQTTFGSRVLKSFRDHPWLTAVTIPFPRFIINSIRWQAEHSPLTFFEMFEPGVKEALLKGAEGGFKHKQATRALARAIDGTLLMNAAWAVRNVPEFAGPKYYQIATGKQDAEGKDLFLDVRSDAPFSNFLFLADVLKSAVEGKPLNVTGNEWVDAITGIRRVADVPIMALDDVLYAAQSQDPERFERAVKSIAGNYVGSFFVKGQEIQNWLATAGGREESAAFRDVNEQELTGPARTSIPGLESGLPARYSPYTGKKIESVSGNVLPEWLPERQLTGLTVSPMSKIEQFAKSLPDLQMSDIVGNYADPVATNLVAKHMGTILGDSDIGDRLAATLSGLGGPEWVKKFAFMKVLEPIRKQALQRAIAENPKVFMEHLLKGRMPGAMLPEIRRMLRDE